MLAYVETPWARRAKRLAVDLIWPPAFAFRQENPHPEDGARRAGTIHVGRNLMGSMAAEGFGFPEIDVEVADFGINHDVFVGPDVREAVGDGDDASAGGELLELG